MADRYIMNQLSGPIASAVDAGMQPLFLLQIAN
jgi:hypothetical protein